MLYTWCVKKSHSLLYKKTLKKIKFDFCLWFEIVIIFKDKTLNLQGINTISKISFVKGRIILFLSDRLNENSEQELHVVPIG